MKEESMEKIIYAIMIIPIVCMIAIFLWFFISVNKVFALDLPQPTRMCVDGFINGQSNQTYCGNGREVILWNKTFWEGPTNYYQIGGYSQSDIYYSNNIQYDILGYCDGQSILISGEIAGISNLFVDKVVNYTFEMNGHNLQCTFEQENMSLMKYTCSGIGGGNFIINVNVPSYSNNDAYEVAFSKSVNVVCDNNISDLMVANQNNTTNIIDAGNQNTIDIIDNDNRNTQSTINSIIQGSDTLRESIEKQNLKCENYNLNKSNMGGQSGNLINTGVINSSSISYVSKYIKINKEKTYNLKPGGSWNTSSYCLYGEDKSLINCTAYTYNTDINITPQFDGFIRFTYDIRSDAAKFTGEYCYNLLEGEPYTEIVVDETEIDDFYDAEDILYGSVNLEELGDFDLQDQAFQIDASQFTWNYIYQWLIQNEKIIGMFFTLLSLGLIKLVM